jgi:hypothetical protein
MSSFLNTEKIVLLDDLAAQGRVGAEGMFRA